MGPAWVVIKYDADSNSPPDRSCAPNQPDTLTENVTICGTLQRLALFRQFGQLGPEEREKRRVGQQAEEWCTNYMIDTYLKYHNRHDPVSPFKAELANLGSSSAVN